MNEDKIITILGEVTQSLFDLRKEMGDKFLELNNKIDDLTETVNDMKPSIKVLDSILEKHTIERIERLEKSGNLPEFSPATTE